MDYSYSYVFEDALGLGVLSGLFSGIPSAVLGIAGYILTSLALYTLAKRRGIYHAWLSWVPVVNVWIVGSLSDQYRYVVKGQNKAKRKVLLTLGIIISVLLAIVIVAVAAILVNVFSGMMYGATGMKLIEKFAGTIMGIVGLVLPLAGVAIAYAIIYFMALYDVFTSMDPDNSVVFLVLSILFNVTEPFFLFFNRNKDKGMPPRRPEPNASTPPQEPWENESRTDYL